MQLNRISWNCVDVHIHRKFWFNFFLVVMPLIWSRYKILLKTVRQRNSTETAQQNFVKLCSYEEHNVYRYAFLQEMLIDLFKEQFISLLNFGQDYFCNSDETGFLSDCLSLMLGIAICCIQHSQAILECGVCELTHSFFHLFYDWLLICKYESV